jgi:hypothetical protein
VAIGVVIPVVLIISIRAGYCFWKRRAHGSEETVPEGVTAMQDPGVYSKLELDANVTVMARWTKDGRQVLPEFELPGESTVVAVPVELDGGRTG